MKVLIVKTSSMGDVIHTLPALSDAAQAIPGIQFDWVVEKSFQDIPHWHPNVSRVIPVQMRQWRKSPLKALRSAEWKDFLKSIKEETYDLIIDAQGLTKSAFLARFARGKRHGLSSRSARDPLAWIHYHTTHKISWDKHAVERIRELFSKALGYEIVNKTIDYGISQDKIGTSPCTGNYLVFFHGTTWDSKLWPQAYWRELVQRAGAMGYSVYLNSGNDVEYQRAQQIAQDLPNAEAMPRKEIKELAAIITHAKGVVSVDTGLGHLAAALAKPNVSLYGATDPKKTGAYGQNQVHLKSSLSCAPCFKTECHHPKQQQYSVQPPCFSSLRPELVWDVLGKILPRE